MLPLFGAAYAAPNKGTTILYWFRSPKTVLNPPVNGKIQGPFKAYEHILSTFQGKFYFQDSPVYSSTFQACANPAIWTLIMMNLDIFLFWKQCRSRSAGLLEANWSGICLLVPVQNVLLMWHNLISLLIFFLLWLNVNPLPRRDTFWRLWKIMYLKILWKMEHLLFWSKCSIFHYIFKSNQNST